MRAVNYVLGEGAAHKNRGQRQRAADAKSLSMLKERNPGFVRALLMAKSARRLESADEYTAGKAEDGIRASRFLGRVIAGEERFKDHDDMLAKIKAAEILIKSADKVYAPSVSTHSGDGEYVGNDRVIEVRLSAELDRDGREPVPVIEATPQS